jgi:hypothetical protein
MAWKRGAECACALTLTGLVPSAQANVGPESSERRVQGCHE